MKLYQCLHTRCSLKKTCQDYNQSDLRSKCSRNSTRENFKASNAAFKDCLRLSLPVEVGPDQRSIAFNTNCNNLVPSENMCARSFRNLSMTIFGHELQNFACKLHHFDASMVSLERVMPESVLQMPKAMGLHLRRIRTHPSKRK